MYIYFWTRALNFSKALSLFFVLYCILYISSLFSSLSLSLRSSLSLLSLCPSCLSLTQLIYFCQSSCGHRIIQMPFTRYTQAKKKSLRANPPVGIVWKLPTLPAACCFDTVVWTPKGLQKPSAPRSWYSPHVHFCWVSL